MTPSWWGARYDWEETLPSSGLGLSNRPGSAYVIERGAGGWSQAAKLRPLAGVRERDDNSIAEFGREVAISADAQLVAVGSPRDVTYGASSGSAHSFRRNGSSWVTEQKLVALLPRAPSKLSGGQWGCSERVAVSGADVLIGCTSAESGGRACLYQFVDPAWDVRLKLLAVAP